MTLYGMEKDAWIIVVITLPNLWFHHKLNQVTQDDIEARLCVANSFARESVLIDQLELYIQ